MSTKIKEINSELYVDSYEAPKPYFICWPFKKYTRQKINRKFHKVYLQNAIGAYEQLTQVPYEKKNPDDIVLCRLLESLLFEKLNKKHNLWISQKDISNLALINNGFEILYKRIKS
jgi:hypothetical protein